LVEQLTHYSAQTLMAVVEKLDQTLFEKYLNPKVATATEKLRGGILDPAMDWYETPQPTGENIWCMLCSDMY
jgi:exocyst complex component 2